MVKSPCKPSVASDALGNLGAPPTWFRPHQKGPGVRRSEPGGFVMGIPIPRWRIGGSPMFGNPHVRTIYIILYITFYTGEDHTIYSKYVYIYIIYIQLYTQTSLGIALSCLHTMVYQRIAWHAKHIAEFHRVTQRCSGSSSPSWKNRASPRLCQ